MPTDARRPSPSRLAALSALARNRGELDAETLRRLLGRATADHESAPPRPAATTAA